ncbi:Gfo/Idh/MocA family protein [Lederbergia galactosidilytica]|uniref:Oxidoreductase n=1 Tax=Lederbergia galactosidilytica TaxID=217031 RepID=A0A177ZGU8_9BACI|nr:Gfo/Idh/MocA family oxidoreductase [Lederbergia galactosidilytica]KRG15401.1 oxidoreductase [Virgibacillus soli]MBP1915833.1 putative dehydrogenase [Lederbergia galactosidilytica]OAK67142.1 oxidoreductase [Lederbergia galactosidilytica]
MDKIRVGMIGTGGISNLHGDQLAELDYVEVVALTDPNVENRKKFITKYQLNDAKEFADHKEMLNHSQLDAVIICSPHTLHFDQAMDVMNHGCHVLIEKPMACSKKEAEELIETSEKLGRVLQVSYQRHFEPEFIYIRDTIASGEIGKLTSVTASLYQQWGHGPDNVWRKNPALSGGGMLMDSGSHICDVLLWTTGLTPLEVTTQMEKHHSPVELDSFTAIRFENNVVAGLNIVGYAPIWHETYAFCGDKGGIFYDNGKVTLHRLREEPIVPELPEKTTNQDKSFFDAILGKHEIKVPGHFAKEVVNLTEMIYNAAGYKPLESNAIK